MTTMPENSVKSLRAIIGQLPSGDIPAAWYSSTDPDVRAGYDEFIAANRDWNAIYKTMLTEAGLSHTTKFVTHANHYLAGLVPKFANGEVPRLMRIDKNGRMVPRKRTVAEKESRVNELWDECFEMPDAEKFIPGIPHTIWQHNRILPVKFRKPAIAVLAFMAITPEEATEPFEVSPQWSRMKLSTYHLLKEGPTT